MGSEWPSDWTRAALGAIADVSWGDTSTTKAAYADEGFTAYSAKGPDGLLPYADFDRTGVVLSAIGADCGRTWLAKGKWSCIKNTIRFWSTAPEVETEFLYWLTSDPMLWPKRGSAQPFISQGDARAIEVAYPPLQEQQAIARILGTLDEKIELNRRANGTLENIARALFRSWFVDFAPVRAKAEGLDTGLPERLAELFPDSFEESELGQTPRGWQVKSLGDLLQVGLGGTWGKDSKTSKATVAVSCLRGIDCHELAEGQFPSVPVRWITPKQFDSRRLDEGVILVEGSGSFCGRSLLWSSVYERLLGDQVIYSNFCKRLDPLLSQAQAVVAWRFMQKAFSEGEIQTFRTGTAFPNLDIHGLLTSFSVCVPPEQLAEEFARFHWQARRLDLIAQSGILAALRDALLPKLMSGELRLKDPERFLRETTT
ncbi:MAG: restriction endonuclease subunit S [Armatimonadetes bacterium]|nr:restriction endonuclease subunit S [Armatimonadota bacterium]